MLAVHLLDRLFDLLLRWQSDRLSGLLIFAFRAIGISAFTELSFELFELILHFF
jgi:hypothetical protein